MQRGGQQGGQQRGRDLVSEVRQQAGDSDPADATGQPPRLIGRVRGGLGLGGHRRRRVRRRGALGQRHVAGLRRWTCSGWARRPTSAPSLTARRPLSLGVAWMVKRVSRIVSAPRSWWMLRIVSVRAHPAESASSKLPGMDRDVHRAVGRRGAAQLAAALQAHGRAGRRRGGGPFEDVGAGQRGDHHAGRARRAARPGPRAAPAGRVSITADPVGQRGGVLERVGDQQGRERELAEEVGELVADLPAGDRVERAERLVEQQHARVAGERARERDALALAAGQLCRACAGRGGRSRGARAGPAGRACRRTARCRRR